MATPGIPFELSEESKQHAIKYVEESGLYKNRLADFLGISRPTLDKVLEENPDFFTTLKRSDAIFCKNLIDGVKKKNPYLILRTKYSEEFPEAKNTVGYDPEFELQRLKQTIDESVDKLFEILPPQE